MIMEAEPTQYAMIMEAKPTQYARKQGSEALTEEPRCMSRTLSIDGGAPVHVR